MPGSLKTEAIVLRSIRYGEADRILHLYTPRHGRIGAIARGARRARSRFGARLEPFFRLRVVLHEGRGDLYTVTSADTVATFGQSWPRPGLDDRSRALISVTIAATLGTHEPLRGQLRIALHSGVTKEEIVELFIHLAAYAGAARAFDGYQDALAVFAEPG